MEKNDDASNHQASQMSQKRGSRSIIAYYIIAITAIAIAGVAFSLYFIGHSGNGSALYSLISKNKTFAINPLASAATKALSAINKLNMTFSGTVNLIRFNSTNGTNSTELLYSYVIDMQKYYDSFYVSDNISSKYINASVFMIFNSSAKYLCGRVGNSTLSCRTTPINLTFTQELLGLFYNSSSFMANRNFSMDIVSIKDSSYGSMPCVLVKAHGSINASVGVNLTTCISNEYYLPLNVTYVGTAPLGMIIATTHETSISDNARPPMSYLPANSIA